MGTAIARRSCGRRPDAPRTRARTGFTVARSLIASVLLLGMSAAQSRAGVVETYYVPIPEDQLRNAYVALQGSTIGTTLTSVTSIVVTGNNTLIYYDQWEDGYEVDITHPTQASTQVWGDGNASNGCAPGVTCTNAADVLTAGQVIALRNNVVLPRNPATLFYDGHDKFSATKALADRKSVM